MDRSRCISGDASATEGSSVRTTLSPRTSADGNYDKLSTSQRKIAGLLLFAKTQIQDAGMLGVLPQYHPEPMPAIAALRFARSRKLDLKTNLKDN